MFTLLMYHVYSFEKLDVWKRSRELVKVVYSMSKNFPKEEKYGITTQIRRAAVSVSNNLAEGSSRISAKDKANFSSMAYSSLMEVLNLSILVRDLEFIGQSQLTEIRELIEEISNKVNALRKSQLNG